MASLKKFISKARGRGMSTAQVAKAITAALQTDAEIFKRLDLAFNHGQEAVDHVVRSELVKALRAEDDDDDGDADEDDIPRTPSSPGAQYAKDGNPSPSDTTTRDDGTRLLRREKRAGRLDPFLDGARVLKRESPGRLDPFLSGETD